MSEDGKTVKAAHAKSTHMLQLPPSALQLDILQFHVYRFKGRNELKKIIGGAKEHPSS